MIPLQAGFNALWLALLFLVHKYPYIYDSCDGSFDSKDLFKCESFHSRSPANIFCDQCSVLFVIAHTSKNKLLNALHLRWRYKLECIVKDRNIFTDIFNKEDVGLEIKTENVYVYISTAEYNEDRHIMIQNLTKI